MVEDLTSVHVNFYWSPVPVVNLGWEVINKDVQTNRAPTGLLGSGVSDSGNASRFQFAAQYLF